ncbi:MAG: class I SAM-dependent methyltransferase [Erysipelothrix sp.]|nr:class I SAM-dependent methyltransferase [Erysipelothrix sp.]
MNKDYLNHYYKDDQKVLSNRKEIAFRFLDFEYKFETADNVFSKDHVDEGTKLLIETALDSGINSEVLDYGCGYGVVGIILSKLGYDTLGLDVTDRALELSAINNQKNNTAFKAYKVDDLNIYKDRFKTILLNPPIRAGKVVIYEMFDNCQKMLASGGQLYVVIRKQHGAASAIKHLQTLFTNVEVIKKSKGFYIIKNFLD